MNKKEEVILIIAALLLVSLIGGLVFSRSGEKKQAIVGKVELIIDFGNGSKRAFEGEIVDNEALVDALNQASKVGNFSYEIDARNNIFAINDVAGGGDKAWRVYLNDKKMDGLTSGVALKSNDKILVKYE